MCAGGVIALVGDIPEAPFISDNPELLLIPVVTNLVSGAVEYYNRVEKRVNKERHEKTEERGLARKALENFVIDRKAIVAINHLLKHAMNW